ncbi:UDP-N-acetylmuramoyl-L-alanine--D-glutamate ligase [Cyanobium sp. CH-040]|uniref:UDP-N-acetylmuramoyl-L-alanine--D-glutamate ligase n=1 Tax=Cyanobium sp. CH-040 TaxID=2823708 RepID=UPI0020CD574C|nr:UDP-N-acetylmuramoyl-L-alanine--D-glutamate ligase [Cyanobium sp. CH-040]MCP9928961.1 UDP-N-acetylmuramoyl-L-alanine--D-glutamate ligase [Cyanobium sp. CH-040]
MTGTRDLSVVIGLGRSGAGAARLLQSLGDRVVVLESRSDAELERQADELGRQGIEVHLNHGLDTSDILGLGPQLRRLVVSPGIRWDHPVFEALRARGVTVQGEVEPAWQASRPVPWIGITGTNGKTTVTHLVQHLLSSAGMDVEMAGNVGQSAAETVLRRRASGEGLPQWMVVELSSYQIESSAAVAPRVGIWTTLTPDHLERHGTLDNYRSIKRRLLERSAVRVLNADDPDLRAHAASWDAATWVTAGARREVAPGIEPDLWIEAGRVWCDRDGQQCDLMAADALAMPGSHNLQNMLLAVAAGLEAGLDGPAMERALRHFPGVPHRLELIRTWQQVRFYNDSKATNYDAAEVALRALEGPLVVLAGGQAKIGEAGPWVQALSRSARAVVLYGQARELFWQRLQEGGYPGRSESCAGLDEAVPLAAALARDLGCTGVLLSPACASFDQYTDFEARGEHFRRLVAEL